MRRIAAVLAGIAILVIVNWTIYARETLLAEGRLVLLELAPVDPRSLMQGDYMALRFRVANEAFGPKSLRDGADGRIIVRLDERGVGRFVRHDDGTPLQPQELALRYRIRGGRVKFATNAFFFEEGTAKRYEAARFGEFRVADTGTMPGMKRGDMLLTGLRNAALESLHQGNP